MNIIKETLAESINLLNNFFPKTGIPVLLYHSVNTNPWIGSVEPAEFAKQMKWLQENYHPVLPSQIVDWIINKKSIPKNSIAITFDDGYKDNLDIAFPIMKKYRFKAAIFPVADKKWRPYNHLPLLNIKNTQTLMANGWELGCHTLTHPNLTTLSKKMIMKEIINSQRILEKRYHSKINYFAYPKGKYNNTILTETQKYFQAAWSVDRGLIHQQDDPYKLKRIVIMKNLSLPRFKCYVTEVFNLIN